MAEPQELPKVQDEIRTRRIVLVDSTGAERFCVDLVDGDQVVELRITAEAGEKKCEVLAYAGWSGPDAMAAGVELWANGDSVIGHTIVVSREGIEAHSFEDRT